MVDLGLPKVKRPKQLGLSSGRLERVSAALREDVERGLIPGAVLVIAMLSAMLNEDTCDNRIRIARS